MNIRVIHGCLLRLVPFVPKTAQILVHPKLQAMEENSKRLAILFLKDLVLSRQMTAPRKLVWADLSRALVLETGLKNRRLSIYKANVDYFVLHRTGREGREGWSRRSSGTTRVTRFVRMVMVQYN